MKTKEQQVTELAGRFVYFSGKNLDTIIDLTPYKPYQLYIDDVRTMFRIYDNKNRIRLVRYENIVNNTKVRCLADRYTWQLMCPDYNKVKAVRRVKQAVKASKRLFIEQAEATTNG